MMATARFGKDSMTSILLAVLLAVPEASPDTVVVCPSPFCQAMEPWLQYRRDQGHEIVVVSVGSSAEEIRGQIRKYYKQGGLKFIVLVGDSPAITEVRDALPPGRVPVHYAAAKVNVLWGSEPHIATDNRYADLDDDQIPDVAIGRLTADTPEQLARIVGKTLDYEQGAGFGPWRRRVSFVAGVGGFGRFADLVLESSVRFLLTRQIPAEYAVNMTYGNWRSPYCPDPRQFHDMTVQRLSEGCLFWVYVGHGLPYSLDRVSVPDADYPILSVADAHQLNAAGQPPIALLLACYTGAIDAVEDCLAEEMLRAPGGPVAVVAGSRVTMPYAMAVLSCGLLEQCVGQRCSTLGEAILQAKRTMVKPSPDASEMRTVLDALATAVSPAPSKLAAERAEHLLLFNLFGDPLLRLHNPQPIGLDLSGSAKPGQVLRIAGTCTVDGPATVELTVRRDRLSFRPPLRSIYPTTSDELSRFQEIYRRANDPRLTSVETAAHDGRFLVEMTIPAYAEGPCNIRAFVEGERTFAMGAVEIAVED